MPDGARFLTSSFSNEAGSRAYKLYIPSTLRDEQQPAPLTVMLHGCSQSPDDFAAGTRMNALAKEQGFLVAYPAQPPSAHARKCWNWFNTPPPPGRAMVSPDRPGEPAPPCYA